MGGAVEEEREEPGGWIGGGRRTWGRVVGRVGIRARDRGVGVGVGVGGFGSLGGGFERGFRGWEDVVEVEVEI